MSCSYCSLRPIHARGLCSSCYARYLKNGTPDRVKVKNISPCTHCGKLGQKAKGLCSACYSRSLHHSTPDRIKVKIVKPCTHCGKESVLVTGLCPSCYQRKASTGTVEYTKVRVDKSCTSCGAISNNSIKGLCRKCYARFRRHGHTDNTRGDMWGKAEIHPLYYTWCGMKRRCSDINDPSYRYYGARGIKVCDRWQNFWLFVSDMGDKPTPLHSIDRIGYTGDYTPNNCRWATSSEQARNRSNNVITQVEASEVHSMLIKNMTVRDISDMLGIPYDTVYNIKSKNTWSKGLK